MSKKKGHPNFVRPNYGRMKKLKSGWRRSRGIDSKQRIHLRHAGAAPRIGYGNAKGTRDFHPMGAAEALVNNVAELKKLSGQAARIASGVGAKKAAEIRKLARELEIKVLN